MEFKIFFAYTVPVRHTINISSHIALPVAHELFKVLPHVVLASPLDTRCEWQTTEGAVDTLPVGGDEMAIAAPPPHSPLPPIVINRLRTLAKKPRPQFRPSTRSTLYLHCP